MDDRRRSAGGNGSRPSNGLNRRGLPYRLRLWLPSTRLALKGALKDVRHLAARCGCSEDRLTDLEIAVVEALANAIEHGNGNRPQKRVFLRVYGGPDAGVVIAVRDEGSGFNPAGVPDPRRSDRLELQHGRGLLMMRELTDHVEHRKGGREVVLRLT